MKAKAENLRAALTKEEKEGLERRIREGFVLTRSWRTQGSERARVNLFNPKTGAVLDLVCLGTGATWTKSE